MFWWISLDDASDILYITSPYETDLHWVRNPILESRDTSTSYMHKKQSQDIVYS